MCRSIAIPGQWNIICAVCGFKKKSSEIKKRWDGIYVCEEDWEIRHPQDKVRVPRDDSSVPFSQPEGTDVERTLTRITSDDWDNL